MKFDLKFSEKINITKEPVQPITITENGVYDATQGGLKYGATVRLRENIPEAEYAAFLEMVEELCEVGGGAVSYGFTCLLIDVIPILIQENYVYIPSMEAVNAFGGSVPKDSVGRWVNMNDGSIIPPEQLTFVLPTKEEYENASKSQTWIVGLEEMQFAFNESIFYKSQSSGYNPVTVNVPIPDGYHKSEDATAIYPEDIRFGLSAYVNGKKIEGTGFIPSGKLTFIVAPQEEVRITIPSDIYVKVDDSEIGERHNFILEASPVYDDEGNQVGIEAQKHEVIVYNSYHESVTAWNNLISFMNYENYNYGSRWSVEYLDIRGVTSLRNVFRRYSGSYLYLKSASFKNTKKLNDIYYAFYNQSDLVSVKGLDLRNVTNVSSAFSGCQALQELELKNIKIALTVGSGTAYGHLLTKDSLVGLLRELVTGTSTRTLTIGSANLTKLNAYYPSTAEYPIAEQPLRVKLVDITDEMRAADDLIDEKLPFEVCSHEEAIAGQGMSYTQYAYMKKWNIK